VTSHLETKRTIQKGKDKGEVNKKRKYNQKGSRLQKAKESK